jgi:small membrane protein
MMGQLMLTALLALVLVYAWSAHRTVPIIGLLASGAALAGLYFVWVPDHATALAAFAGIGRGSDLIVYTWVVISLLITLNLHLKLRLQLDMITRLARAVAIDRAKESRRETGPPARTSPGHVGPKGRGAPDRIAGEEVDAIVKARRI